MITAQASATAWTSSCTNDIAVHTHRPSHRQGQPLRGRLLAMLRRQLNCNSPVNVGECGYVPCHCGKAVNPHMTGSPDRASTFLLLQWKSKVDSPPSSNRGGHESHAQRGCCRCLIDLLMFHLASGVVASDICGLTHTNEHSMAPYLICHLLGSKTANGRATRRRTTRLHSLRV